MKVCARCGKPVKKSDGWISREASYHYLCKHPVDQIWQVAEECLYATYVDGDYDIDYMIAKITQILRRKLRII